MTLKYSNSLTLYHQYNLQAARRRRRGGERKLSGGDELQAKMRKRRGGERNLREAMFGRREEGKCDVLFEFE